MSYYINPLDSSKEEWLGQHGTEVSLPEVKRFSFANGTLPVCLVDNGAFSAAAILYDPRERDCFTAPNPRDRRPKRWFLVSKQHLLPWYDD